MATEGTEATSVLSVEACEASVGERFASEVGLSTFNAGATFGTSGIFCSAICSDDSDEKPLEKKSAPKTDIRARSGSLGLVDRRLVSSLVGAASRPGVTNCDGGATDGGGEGASGCCDARLDEGFVKSW